MAKKIFAIVVALMLTLTCTAAMALEPVPPVTPSAPPAEPPAEPPVEATGVTWISFARAKELAIEKSYFFGLAWASAPELVPEAGGFYSWLQMELNHVDGMQVAAIALVNGDVILPDGLSGDLFIREEAFMDFLNWVVLEHNN